MFQNFLNRSVKMLTQLDMGGFTTAGLLSLFWKSDSVWEVKHYKQLNLFINIDFHFKPICWGYDWTEGSTSCMIHEKSTYDQRNAQNGTVHVEIGETCKKSKYIICYSPFLYKKAPSSGIKLKLCIDGLVTSMWYEWIQRHLFFPMEIFPHIVENLKIN